MNGDVERRLRRSTADFVKLVWPNIGSRFGELEPVESVTANHFADELDRRAGIDHWIMRRDGHMSGLASRVQWTDRSYDTFTIRVRSQYGNPTEYHKRRDELRTPGALGPWYVCQAYISVDRTRLVAAAVAQMADVIAAVEQERGRLLPRNADGTQGFAVPWRHLDPIHICRPPTDDGQLRLLERV